MNRLKLSKEMKLGNLALGSLLFSQFFALE